LHAFTAPVFGSGKSMLVDLAALLATGNPAPVIAQGRSEEETEKRLGAAFIAGDAVVSLDNCDLALQGNLLCQSLTQQRLNIRVLGQSRNAEVLANAAMFATGNNLTVAGDMTRRVLRCEIDPKMERPELREFAFKPREVLRVERGRYVVAALTILRAYAVAGRPAPGKPLGSFEDWSRLVRDALCWLGEADPCETIDTTRSDDPERAQLASLLHHWSEVIGEQRVTTKEIIAATAGSDKVEARAALNDGLLSVAASFVRGGTAVDPRRLGVYLSKNAGRVIDGLLIVKDTVKHGDQLWRLDYQW
jgi:hypothetical protein